LNTIGAEKTDVTMSVYVELTLESNTAVERDPTGYDRRVSRPDTGWPLWRIVLVPLVLFVVVSGTAFTLAKLHPARPSVPTGAVTLGDAQSGRAVFLETCAPCHGRQAQGGVGPRLAGASITLAAAKAQIDNGGGVMPARLVTGGRQDDVLAYLRTILAGG